MSKYEVTAANENVYTHEVYGYRVTPLGTLELFEKLTDVHAFITYGPGWVSVECVDAGVTE